MSSFGFLGVEQKSRKSEFSLFTVSMLGRIDWLPAGI